MEQIPLMKLCEGRVSRLLRLALRDLEAAERRPDVSIEMHHWLCFQDKCVMCLAGAVMAGTLGATPSLQNLGVCGEVVPGHFPDSQWPLNALDLFRQGLVGLALCNLGHDPWYSCGGFCPPVGVTEVTGIPDYFEVPSYSRDPRYFKQRLTRLADMFQAWEDRQPAVQEHEFPTPTCQAAGVHDAGVECSDVRPPEPVRSPLIAS